MNKPCLSVRLTVTSSRFRAPRTSCGCKFPGMISLQAYLCAYSFLREVTFVLLLWNSFQWRRHIFFCISSVSWNVHQFKTDCFISVIVFDTKLFVVWHINTSLLLFVGQESWNPIVFMPKSSLKICLSVSVSKFSYTAIALILKHLSECIRFCSFSIFSSVLWDPGRPLLLSFSTFSWPSLNRLCHSETLECSITSPPWSLEEHFTSVTLVFPNFTQNLMSIRCSKNRSLIFATRRRNTHVLSTPQLPHNWR
jgi:hypothetical protein